MRRTLSIAARLLVLLLVLGIVGPFRQAALANSLVVDLVGSQSTPTSGQTPLRITGTTPQLWPGHRAPLDVRLSSSAGNASAVRVLALTVTVGDASPACGAENVAVTGYTWSPTTATYAVAPGRTVVVPLTITMVDTGKDQNRCQGARFPVHYALTSAAVR